MDERKKEETSVKEDVWKNKRETKNKRRKIKLNINSRRKRIENIHL